MADPEEGAPAAPEDAAPAASEDAAPAASEDAKARFREALERKQEAGHRTADGRRNTGPVHGSEVAGGGRRTFRRKTG